MSLQSHFPRAVSRGNRLRSARKMTLTPLFPFPLGRYRCCEASLLTSDCDIHPGRDGL